MARIVFIGAGSAVFTRNLVADLITFPELADTEVVLMDVDEERLDRITRITEYVIKQENARLSLRSTLSRAGGVTRGRLCGHNHRRRRS
jgi:alpha-galactosidase